MSDIGLTGDFLSTVSSGGSKPVCRIGDKDVFHDCSVPVNAEGSTNVFVNGIGVFRLGDSNNTHIINGSEPCNSEHSAPLAQASQTVFVNGKGCSRIGDQFGNGCTMTAEGSQNVFAG